MTRKEQITQSDVTKVLLVLLGLMIAAGAGYGLVPRTTFSDNPALAMVPQMVYVALIYMPTPLYALLISKFLLGVDVPFRRLLLFKGLSFKNYFLAAGIFLLWLAIMVGLVALLGWMWPEVFGAFVQTNAQLLANIERLFGSAANAGLDLPSPLILLPIGAVGTLMAGLTINALFAMTEEIMWRGYLSQKITLPFYKKHLLIGFIWGAWHVPLIALGYNYGAENALLGVPMFIAFYMSFALLFGLLIERTKVTWLAAILHGTFSGLAGIFTLLIVGGSPLLASSAVGVVSVVAMLLNFVLWRRFIKIEE